MKLVSCFEVFFVAFLYLCDGSWLYKYTLDYGTNINTLSLDTLVAPSINSIRFDVDSTIVFASGEE